VTQTTDRLLKGIELFKELNQTLKEEAAAVVGRGDHLEVLNFFFIVGQMYDELSAMKKGYNTLYDGFSMEHVPDTLRAQGVKNIVIEIPGVGNRRFQMSNRFACTILDKDKGFQWLRENGLGDIIKPTVNAQTLAASAKELMESHGKEMPEEIFKTTVNTFTSVVAVK
jgi:hypothetical protein